MTEMVERVARVIDTAITGFEKGSDTPIWGPALFAARLAIAVMREPTEAMISEGYQWTDTTVSEQWRAMIDAALAEPMEQEATDA